MSDSEELILTEEKIGFDPAELAVCEKCGRKNAPNRLKCLYCAADLAIADASNVKLDHKRPEIWENGINLICVSRPDAGVDTAAMSKVTGIEAELLENLLHGKLPLPVARVGSENEAKVLIERFGGHGIVVKPVNDELLKADGPPNRLRSIEFDDGAIIFGLFNSDEIVVTSADDIELIVVGRLFENEVESTERRKFRKGELTDQIASRSDSTVVDIYLAGNSKGFRIHEHGFDFSCLGGKKSFLAGDNIRLLVKQISESAPNAAVEDQYDLQRGPLGEVWELQETQDSSGLQRIGFGKMLITRSTRQNNVIQFTKYSRMLRHFR